MSEYPCTECGGDAMIGMMALKNLETGEYIIGKNERLCMRCSGKRHSAGNNPFIRVTKND